MELSENQKKYLVNKINEKINLPILGERGERKIFAFAIDKILETIKNNIPVEILPYINDIAVGLVPGGDADLDDAKEATVRMLNKEINIPFMGEKREKELFETVVDLLFNAMQKGNKLAA